MHFFYPFIGVDPEVMALAIKYFIFYIVRFYLKIFFNYKCLVENMNFNIKTYEIEINLLIESQIGFFLINFYSQQKKYSTIF